MQLSFLVNGVFSPKRVKQNHNMRQNVYTRKGTV